MAARVDGPEPAGSAGSARAPSRAERAERAERADGRPGDLRWGAFSAHGPWEIDPARAGWRAGVQALRRSTQAELPGLTRRRWIPPLARMLRTVRLIAAALLGWLLVERRRGGSESVRGLSHRLRRAFERLGSSYIKLGQIISAGQGVFPDELVAEFELCRDRVAPEAFATVRRVVEEDLGRPLEAVFAEFAPEPLAAASIAQVHAARLHSGEPVVVKVQRPQVYELVRRDIETMAWIAPMLIGRIPVAALANPPALVELFAETILEELDFRLEAENMLEVAGMLREAKQEIFVVPRPHPRLVTRRVLVMERLEGFAYEDVEQMRAAGVDTHAMLRAAFIAFLEGAMIYGVFHGDLHGGNMFVMPDGRIALLDYGITARLSPLQRGAFLRMLMTGAVNDVRGQLAAFRDLGALPPDTDLDAVVRDLKLDQAVRDPTRMTPEELVEEIRSAVKALLGYGARLPKALMLYVKNLIFLDGAVARFAPDVNLFAEVGHIFQYFATHHGERISREAGIDPRAQGVNLDGLRAGLGLEGDVSHITHRDLQKRRALIQKRMEGSRRELRRKLEEDARS